MQLTWNEISARAARFAEDWRHSWYEKGEAQSFYNDFFDVFGVKRRSVARFEQHVRKLNNSSGFIDLFWPSVLLVEHKSLGADLEKAADQAADYFDAIDEDQKPRFQLVCDFQTFELLDRDAERHIAFTLDELPKFVQEFAFILGKQGRVANAREPVNAKAAAIVGELFRSLSDSGYPPIHLERCITRLVFCLFADSTGIFQPRAAFEDLVYARSDESGRDLGPLLSNLFQTLNTPEAARPRNLDPDIAQFPFINGGLFAERIDLPSFDEEMRDALLAACGYDWAAVSPAIFGSLFQSVLDPEERRQLGGHFTSEENIRKLLKDLFLEDLECALHKAQTTRFNTVDNLRAFISKLRSIKVFDPACGCGNFLAVAYGELRRLELSALQSIHAISPLDLASSALSVVDVDQFFGIEDRQYSARIAETALWMTDHIANNALNISLGANFYRVPLIRSPRIEVGDALALDWHALCPPSSSTFVVGNPPYQGAKVQSSGRRERVRELAGLGRSGGTLDYVCGWVIKAAEFAREGAFVGLVTTNSITQGEQAGQLWPLLFDRFGIEISFAHQAFAWNEDAPAKARVHVVILGLSAASSAPVARKLYSYQGARNPVVATVKSISPYLIPGDRLADSHATVAEAPRPMNGLRRIRTGSKPIDGGYFILDESEKSILVGLVPTIDPFIRPFIGSEEFLSGKTRHIMVLASAPPEVLSAPLVAETLKKVEAFRRGEIPSKDGKRKLKARNPLWERPAEFHFTASPAGPFLIIPEVSSERRRYVPIGWAAPPTMPSNLVKYLPDATLAEFALLTSAMHMSWLAVVGGKLEGRYRYSLGVVYNQFPAIDVNGRGLDALAQEVLDARREFGDRPLKQLYDRNSMPSRLLRAHRSIDSAVDKLYLGRDAGDDQERIEVLLNMYSSRRA